MLVEMLVMLKRGTNLSNLIEAIEVKSKSKFISRMNIWASQVGLLKLLRSLEGGTKVQQIITGYFCSSSFKNKPLK
jgi:hypothetical protein